MAAARRTRGPLGDAAAAFRAPQPPITPDPISFGNDRKRQMARYSKRHYGKREWRLSDPRVIVLHFTATDSYSSVWNTFDANTPSLGESPGTCAHYVIEQDGTIDQLVSAADPLPPHDRAQPHVGRDRDGPVDRAAARTGPISRSSTGASRSAPPCGSSAGCRAATHIPTSEVIGHAMANDDRYFKDLEGWVNDHTDWLKRDVKEFRRRL